jgi:hypothetical protein
MPGNVLSQFQRTLALVLTRCLRMVMGNDFRSAIREDPNLNLV